MIVKKEMEDFFKFSFKNIFDGINSKLHIIEKSNLKADKHKWLKMSQWK